jgi:L-ascorbate metabolism protein UlaG (beta-lactamase superfamily)
MVELSAQDCQEGGATKVDYYGYMAVLITSPCGLRGIFDPWRDAQPGLLDPETGDTRGWDKVTWVEHKFPRLLDGPRTSKVDYAVSTHAHFDHDNIYGIDASTVLDRMIGTWEFADVRITGLADMHVCVTKGMWPWDETARQWWFEPCGPDRPRDQDNVIYYIESGRGDDKVTFVHWGDNNFDMLAQNKEFFATHPVDVAFIPVDDSGHIVTPEQVPQIVQDLKPKVLVPTHYFIKGIINPSYTTLTADRWFVAQKNRQLADSANFEFSRAWLDGLDLADGEFLALYFADKVAFDVIDVPENWESELEKSRAALEDYKKSNP